MNEDIIKSIFGNDISERISNNRCPLCNKEITGFRDSLSEKEFKISGLCQECQDKIWSKD